MTRPPKRTLLYAFIALVALIGALFGLTNGRIFGVTPAPEPIATPTATASTPLGAQPAPTLFKDAELLPVSSLLGLQSKRAYANIDQFYADQPTGHTVDDAAFARWAPKQVAAEPSAYARSRERVEVAHFPRSAKRDVAARWLGLHGCRDVWTQFTLDQQELHPASAPVATSSELTEVIDLAARVADAAQKKYASADGAAPPPCTPANPSAADACGCTFPSTTAAMTAAARTYLGVMQPMLGQRYRWMEQQVDLAAVYQGQQLPSDVEAGAYLGYLTARYYLASHGYTASTPTPTPTPTTR